MPLIKRLVKGSPLTFAEGDNNLQYLEDLALSGSGGNINTGSFATTGSNTFNGNQIITGSLITTQGLTGSLQGTASWATNFTSASNYVLNSQTSSFVTNSQTSSMTVATASYIPNYLTTGSSGITQTISGSLTINQNLTVLGSSSIQYITSSQLNIGTNLITVNTATPAVRFGGLAVYDSGSTGTGLTGSILWDSQNNTWIYSNPSGSSYDGAMILVGPRNSTGIGNEQPINQGYAAVGDGSHHMTSSAIYSSGSLIRLENNTQVTGSLNVSAGITGSLQSLKALSGSVASFGGTPKSSSITFTSPFPNNLYAVTVTGEDARIWTIQSKTSGSFTINSNSSVALTGPIYWIATAYN
jgi:hypothetical protein